MEAPALWSWQHNSYVRAHTQTRENHWFSRRIGISLIGFLNSMKVRCKCEVGSSTTKGSNGGLCWADVLQGEGSATSALNLFSLAGT